MFLRHRFSTSSVLALALLACNGAPSSIPSASTPDTVVDQSNALSASASAGSALVPMAPAPFLDRTVPSSQFAPGESRSITVTGLLGVPPGVTAVAVALSVSSETAAGFLSTSSGASGDLGYPLVSFNLQQEVDNFVILPVSSSGKINLINRSTGTIRVDAMLVGAFAPDHPAACGLRGVTNRKLVDAQTAPLGAGETRRIPVTSSDGPLAGQNLTAVWVNVMTQNSLDGFVTVQPLGSNIQPRTVELRHRETRTGSMLVTLNQGAFSITNHSFDTAEVDVTLEAAASPTDAATHGRFVSTTPQLLFKGKLPASGDTTGYTLPPPLPTTYKTLVMTQLTTSNVAGVVAPFSCIAIDGVQYVNAGDFANVDLVSSFYPNETRTSGGLVSEDKRIHDQLSGTGCTGDLQVVSWGYFTP